MQNKVMIPKTENTVEIVDNVNGVIKAILENKDKEQRFEGIDTLIKLIAAKAYTEGFYDYDKQLEQIRLTELERFKPKKDK
ncbi:MAG: hypothetical protein GY793_11225 [Proteobacteria bacterium]|nr:hypothetical protein [Pseudomonadota bacterium]